MSEDVQAAEAPQAPLLRVISPSATPEEIAAIVAVVSAMAAGTGPAPRKPVREWASPGRVHRPPHHAGRGAWRASALPR